MRISYILLTLLVIFIFNSCSTDSSNEYGLIEVDLNESRTGKYSDFFESIDYKILKTNEINPLVRPYSIRFSDSLIFVQDMVQNHILIFNSKGENISTIKNVGDGPNEYRSIDDFQLSNGNLWIKDGLAQKMLKFSLEGNLIETQKNEFLRGNFFKCDEFILYYLNNDPDYNGRILKVKDKEIEEFVDMDQWLQKRMVSHINGFINPKGSNSIYFMLPFTYEIAEFNRSSGVLRNLYRFDFKEFNIPKRIREEFGEIKGELDYAVENSAVYDLSNFLPIGSGYLVFLRQESGKSHFIFLNSEFGVEKQFSQFDNDLDGFVIKNMPWTFSEGKIYFTMHSRQFLNEYKIQFEEGLNSNQNIHKFYDENMEYFDDENLVLIGLTVK
ncbi:6-bladed beta-propeller [Mongoliibacter ruber]|uniref:6-bladed beta-propeller protein n=1 Tax=Mongoliibacter ruber TaxID=1750599 RepID=A0A2T0WHX9_9BACT|nr:6-bladed beta-propeller [Mongoliibacter ruber]PRY86296.1 6-bladed beta-propeller protein [Mongoliibacter ruber]